MRIRPSHGQAIATVLVVAASIAVGSVVNKLTGVNGGLWAWWIGLVGLATVPPLVIWRFARRREAFALMPLIAGFWMIEFLAGGVFYRVPRLDSALTRLGRSYTPEDMQIALLISFCAFCALVGGYFVFNRLRVLRRAPRPSLGSQEVVPVAVVLLALGWLARVEAARRGWYFHIEASGGPAESSTLRQVVTITANLATIAGAMLFVVRARLWLPVLLAEIGWAIPTGGRFNVLALGLMLLVVRYFSSRSVSGRWLVVGTAVAVFLVFPAGAIYRGADVGRANVNYQADPAGNLQRTAETYVGLGPNVIGVGLTETFRRFTGAVPIAALNRYGTSRYPTDETDAMVSWLGAVVPRALLPTKADPSNVPNRFAQEYNIVTRDVKASYATVTVVGDLYGTFGLPLMFLGMFVIGGVIRALDEWFYDRRSNVAALGTYSVLCGGLILGFESTVAVGPVQSLRELAVYVLAITSVTWVVRRVRRPVPRALAV